MKTERATSNDTSAKIWVRTRSRRGGFRQRQQRMSPGCISAKADLGKRGRAQGSPTSLPTSRRDAALRGNSRTTRRAPNPAADLPQHEDPNGSTITLH